MCRSKRLKEFYIKFLRNKVPLSPLEYRQVYFRAGERYGYGELIWHVLEIWKNKKRKTTGSIRPKEK